MRTNVASVYGSMDVHVIYRVTCDLGQKEATSKRPDVVMTVCNGVYVTQHKCSLPRINKTATYV